MRSSLYGVGAFGVVLPLAFALYSCGAAQNTTTGGGGGKDGGGGGGGGMDAFFFGSPDGGSSIPDSAPPFMDASFTAPDCPNCTFPPLNAAACASSRAAL